jgi:hypothetical protein
MSASAQSSSSVPSRRGWVRRTIHAGSALERLQTESLQAQIGELSAEIAATVTRGARQIETATRRERRLLERAARKDNLGLGQLDSWPSLPEGAEGDLDELVRLRPALEQARARTRQHLERIREVRSRAMRVREGTQRSCRRMRSPRARRVAARTVGAVGGPEPPEAADDPPGPRPIRLRLATARACADFAERATHERPCSHPVAGRP